MARFPSTEPDTLVLAQAIAAGLAANNAIYPTPPVAVVELGSSIAAYGAARNAATAAQAAARAAITAKDDALHTMVEKMKTELRYAELTVDFDDDQLKLLGWAGRAAKSPLKAPGQVRSLEAPQQGEGWIFLDWKAPIDGGAVAAYKIQRRLRPDGVWTDVAMALASEATLSDQTRGCEWEYRVLAVNKSGEGLPSNTVMAVL